MGTRDDILRSITTETRSAPPQNQSLEDLETTLAHLKYLLHSNASSWGTQKGQAALEQTLWEAGRMQELLQGEMELQKASSPEHRSPARPRTPPTPPTPKAQPTAPAAPAPAPGRAPKGPKATREAPPTPPLAKPAQAGWAKILQKAGADLASLKHAGEAAMADTRKRAEAESDQFLAEVDATEEAVHLALGSMGQALQAARQALLQRREQSVAARAALGAGAVAEGAVSPRSAQGVWEGRHREMQATLEAMRHALELACEEWAREKAGMERGHAEERGRLEGQVLGLEARERELEAQVQGLEGRVKGTEDAARAAQKEWEAEREGLLRELERVEEEGRLAVAKAEDATARSQAATGEAQEAHRRARGEWEAERESLVRRMREMEAAAHRAATEAAHALDSLQMSVEDWRRKAGESQAAMGEAQRAAADARAAHKKAAREWDAERESLRGQMRGLKESGQEALAVARAEWEADIQGKMRDLAKFVNTELDKKGGVRVVVRVCGRQLPVGAKRAVRCFPDGHRVGFLVPFGGTTEQRMKWEEWTANSVIDSSASLEELYRPFKGVAERTLKGLSSTVFTYGQAGTGKTHCLEGTSEDRGLVERTLEDLFDAIEVSGRDVNVKVVMVQVYLNKVTNMLPRGREGLPHYDEGRARGPRVPLEIPEKDAEVELAEGGLDGDAALQISRDARGRVTVPGANEWVAKTCRGAKALFKYGRQWRKGSSGTSQSHQALIISTHSQDPATREIVSGKLALVDLAGTDKPKDSKAAAGSRESQEVQDINRSLTALQAVMAQIADNPASKPDFTGHSLTLLLRDSVGGSATTYMLATLSPADTNVLQSRVTLNFASMVRKVQNKDQHTGEANTVERLMKQNRDLLRRNVELESVMEGVLGHSHGALQGTMTELPLLDWPNETPPSSSPVTPKVGRRSGPTKSSSFQGNASGSTAGHRRKGR